MRRAGMGNERGIALGVIILSALMFSAAAVAALQMSMNSSQTSEFQEDRLRARYAGEAGLVKAMQKLWASPSECFAANPDYSFDTDDDKVDDTNVDIIATPCPAPGVSAKLQAKVSF